MPAPEAPTQVEKDKLDIDPDFDFREIANRPFEDLTANEIGMFKWSGVYHQLQTGRCQSGLLGRFAKSLGETPVGSNPTLPAKSEYSDVAQGLEC